MNESLYVADGSTNSMPKQYQIPAEFPRPNTKPRRIVPGFSARPYRTVRPSGLVSLTYEDVRPYFALQATKVLRNNFCYHSGSHCLSTFTNGETHLVFDGDGAHEFHFESHGVARHDHLHPLFERDLPGHIRRSDVELWLLAGEERRATASFLLGEDVELLF